MYRLVEFIRRSYVIILFLLLETAAIIVYMRSTPYTRAKMLARVYSVFGGIASAEAEIESYFSLPAENRMLTERVAELENTLAQLQAASDERIVNGSGEMVIPEGAIAPAARYMAARVVSNSVNRTHNYIILNRGEKDGVHEGMSVITPSGCVAGYVYECSKHYCAAVSILNTSFRSSGKIEGSEFSGSIEWQGKSPYYVTMSDISKYAGLEVGKRIVTTGFSSYFLPDMTIGTVSSFAIDPSHNYYTATVKLEADMSSLHNVLIVENPSRDEITALQQKTGGNNK